MSVIAPAAIVVAAIVAAVVAVRAPMLGLMGVARRLSDDPDPRPDGLRHEERP